MLRLFAMKTIKGKFGLPRLQDRVSQAAVHPHGLHYVRRRGLLVVCSQGVQQTNIILKATRYEKEKGYINVQGKTSKFAPFAKDALFKLKEGFEDKKRIADVNSCINGLQRYDSLSYKERIDVVALTERLASALVAAAPRTSDNIVQPQHPSLSTTAHNKSSTPESFPVAIVPEKQDPRSVIDLNDVPPHPSKATSHLTPLLPSTASRASGSSSTTSNLEVNRSHYPAESVDNSEVLCATTDTSASITPGTDTPHGKPRGTGKEHADCEIDEGPVTEPSRPPAGKSRFGSGLTPPSSQPSDADCTGSATMPEHVDMHVDSQAAGDVGIGTAQHVDDAEVEYVMVGKKRMKSATVAFRQDFYEAALAAEAVEIDPSRFVGQQRSEAWHELRNARLTASSFAQALGFFADGRVRLWEEKVGLAEKFKGNRATKWGETHEEQALEEYQRVTGQKVTPCMFQVKRDDEAHGWMGASPDGLIAAAVEGTVTSPCRGKGANIVSGNGLGIVELKCPFNSGRPNHASPPSVPQWYYVPQAQGLMDVFDRHWCNLYVWTLNGSSLFHMARDMDYWQQCFQVLSEFWWENVVPARIEMKAGNPEAVEQFRPTVEHSLTSALRERSQQMAKLALATYYPSPAPLQPPTHRRRN